jgi:hypothetical protein
MIGATASASAESLSYVGHRIHFGFHSLRPGSIFHRRNTVSARRTARRIGLSECDLYLALAQRQQQAVWHR